jgi:hypothetical protein
MMGAKDKVCGVDIHKKKFLIATTYQVMEPRYRSDMVRTLEALQSKVQSISAGCWFKSLKLHSKRGDQSLEDSF